VSTNPYCVAVKTDLSCRDGFPDCEVVRIVAQPLELMTGGPPSVGQRLATIALYSRGPREKTDGRWETFWPTVVNCVTSNQSDINRVFDQLSQEAWNELDVCLAQVPKPYKVGYQYYVSSKQPVVGEVKYEHFSVQKPTAEPLQQVQAKPAVAQKNSAARSSTAQPMGDSQAPNRERNKLRQFAGGNNQSQKSPDGGKRMVAPLGRGQVVPKVLPRAYVLGGATILLLLLLLLWQHLH
jgi:hypothetical protein